ncbi:MAG: hypothetical protein K1X57_17595 [Gemmataceae bacterium]|nr:hypothetical protein [Gemmataceae bacterium]
MDGILRQITPKTWQGALLGYRVQVFRNGSGWVASIGIEGSHTIIQLEAARFEWAAARARAWIEENPLPATSSKRVGTTPKTTGEFR